MGLTRRAFAWLWLTTGFRDARDSLQREGVLFAVLAALVGAAYAWWLAARIPARWLWSKWPWDVYEEAPGNVSVLDVLSAPLVVLGACCFLYLMFHLVAAPYRMQKTDPRPQSAPAGGSSAQNVTVNIDKLFVGGSGGSRPKGTKTLWVPRSVAEAPSTQHDEASED